MNKKFLTIVLVFSLVFVLNGCSNKVIKDGGKTSVLLMDEEEELEEIMGTEYVYFEGVEGRNVLELLKEVALVEVDEVEGGIDVRSIDGISDDYVKLKRWVFYVNGEEMNVSSDQVMTKEGDMIEWYYGGRPE